MQDVVNHHIQINRAPDNFWVQCVFTRNFWLNTDFQNFKWYFNPYFFFAMLNIQKGEYYCCVVAYLLFWCHFKYSFGIDLLLFVPGIILQTLVCIKHCYTYHNAKETIGNVDKHTDGWTLSIQHFTFVLILTICTHCFGHQYNMLMRIFTPCLFFRCFF